MDNTDLQSTVTHVDIQPDSDTLIVAFTGKAAKFNMIRPFDFFRLTGLLQYSRILIREPWHYAYLRGIDKTGLNGLAQWLESEIKRIAPKRVIFVGVSSGGFAALMLGQILNPDYVHAFSPFTYFDVRNAIKNKDYKNAILKWPLAMLRLHLFLPRSARKYFDLKPYFMKNTGKTKYAIHACAHSSDRTRAEHLSGCPFTQVFLYPCSTHNVTWTMLKSRCIRELLKVNNLDRTAEVYREYFKDFDPEKSFVEGETSEESMPAMEKEKHGIS